MTVCDWVLRPSEGNPPPSIWRPLPSQAQICVPLNVFYSTAHSFKATHSPGIWLQAMLSPALLASAMSWCTRGLSPRTASFGSCRSSAPSAARRSAGFCAVSSSPAELWWLAVSQGWRRSSAAVGRSQGSRFRRD